MHETENYLRPAPAIDCDSNSIRRTMGRHVNLLIELR